MIHHLLPLFLLVACVPSKDGGGLGSDLDEDNDGFEASEDCDDGDPSINPDAFEICDADDADEDCNGLAEDEDPWVVGAGLVASWPDIDGDGYGAGTAFSFCDIPTGYVADDTDCDDSLEVVYPGASEVCDGYDNDCDGYSDESDAADGSTWYGDLDGDGYGGTSGTRDACTQPEGFVADRSDCDDGSLGVYPGARETCDGEDDDCDGDTDESDASDAETWYADDDDATVSPAGSEVCDSADTDEDCDLLSDDDDNSVSAAGKSTYYWDSDADGYGVSTTTVVRCALPSGYSTLSTDCDDSSAARDPGNTEVCDASNVDEDCDNYADDNDSSVSAATETSWYTDAGADGYGLDSSAIS